MTMALPLFEVILLNRASPNSVPQIFCNIRINDLFFQQLNTLGGKYGMLMRIEDINVVNRSKVLERFEVVLKKKPKVSILTEDESDEFLSRINSEVEEELEPLENDGLPPIEYFSSVMNCNTNLPLILFEYIINPKPSNEEHEGRETNNIDMKLNVNHFEFYFDRIMINVILNNIIQLQNKMQGQSALNEQKFKAPEDMNRSRASVNLNVSRTSHGLRKLESFKSTAGASKVSLPYRSMHITFDGASLFFPDSLSFKDNSNRVM